MAHLGNTHLATVLIFIGHVVHVNAIPGESGRLFSVIFINVPETNYSVFM